MSVLVLPPDLAAEAQAGLSPMQLQRTGHWVSCCSFGACQPWGPLSPPAAEPCPHPHCDSSFLYSLNKKQIRNNPFLGGLFWSSVSYLLLFLLWCGDAGGWCAQPTWEQVTEEAGICQTQPAVNPSIGQVCFIPKGFTWFFKWLLKQTTQRLLSCWQKSHWPY